MQSDPVPFPANAQYKKNMSPDGDDDEAEGQKKPRGRKSAKKSKVGKKSRASIKGKKAKAKATQRRNKNQRRMRVLREAPKRPHSAANPRVPSLPASLPAAAAASASGNQPQDYKPGEFCMARDRFLERVRRLLKVDYKTACAMWNESSERRSYLRNMSVSELKRRRFVAKGTTINPFA